MVTDAYTYTVAFNDETGEFEFTKTGLAPEPEPEPEPDPDPDPQPDPDPDPKPQPDPEPEPEPEPTPEPISAVDAATPAALAGAMAQMAVENISAQVISRDIAPQIGISSGDAQKASPWVKAFNSDNDVELKHLSGKVDTHFYGLIGGVDSRLLNYDNGLKAVYGIYGAYTGSKQKYAGNEIKQQGGYLGLSAALRKEMIFSNFTVNGGYLQNKADTPWGRDKFDTKVISVANRSGVDVPTSYYGLTLTPALSLSYMGINTEDYTSKSGVKVDNRFMNVFEIAPELKLTKGFDNGLKSYAKVAYKVFIYDNNKVKADDVLLPEMSVKPYVEYGIGLDKSWGTNDDVSSYAEVMRHDGGREGWDFSLGLKLDF